MLPYDAGSLRALIEGYNLALWPAQPLALVLGAGVLLAVARARAGGPRVVAALLAAGWAWTGVVYLAGFYAALNWAGWVYAALFVTQAVALAWRGGVRAWPPLARRGAGYWPGLALSCCALLAGVVPWLASGGGIGATRVVGLLPDPTAVFTLGVLLAHGGAPRPLALAPLAWCAWSAWWWWQLQQPAGVLLPALGFAVTLLAWCARPRR